MTPLADALIRRITAAGPITLAEFMAASLGDPEHGYYITRDPFGRAGDFTTSPEISQMFGELLGLCLAQCWQDQGAPGRFVLAELGPGRGTLMTDLLRAGSSVPGFREAAELHLVETSPALREIQKQKLPDAIWHETTATLPQAPLYLIANEFFDALPIRQARRESTGWSERMVGVEDGRLVWGWSPPAPLAALDKRLDDTRTGDIVEWCAPARAISREIGCRIAARGGAAILIDYGDWVSQGNTFQAVAGHLGTDPLDKPGLADLSAHVDFAALAGAAREAGATHSRLTPQGVFLERLGITARAQAIAGRLSGDALGSHIAAHRRLTHPAEMGQLFKAMSIHPADSPPPPGLAP